MIKLNRRYSLDKVKLTLTTDDSTLFLHTETTDEEPIELPMEEVMGEGIISALSTHLSRLMHENRLEEHKEALIILHDLVQLKHSLG